MKTIAVKRVDIERVLTARVKARFSDFLGQDFRLRLRYTAVDTPAGPGAELWAVGNGPQHRASCRVFDGEDLDRALLVAAAVVAVPPGAAALALAPQAGGSGTVLVPDTLILTLGDDRRVRTVARGEAVAIPADYRDAPTGQPDAAIGVASAAPTEPVTTPAEPVVGAASKAAKAAKKPLFKAKPEAPKAAKPAASKPSAKPAAKSVPAKAPTSKAPRKGKTA